jgi:hypothetical protein
MAWPPAEDWKTVGLTELPLLFRRFFRARGYDVEAALQQYSTTVNWREDNGLIDLYEHIDVADYEETRKMVWRTRPSRPSDIKPHDLILTLLTIGQQSTPTGQAGEILPVRQSTGST